MVQSETRRALNSKMEVRILLPEPVQLKRYFDDEDERKKSSGGTIVFIRFVSGEMDESSHVLAGLFCAARRLWVDDDVPDYELDALDELRIWFGRNLWSPFDFLPECELYDRAVCWFKPSAREHLARAWELVSLLERNNILIWVVKSPKTGYVYYEDEEQVFAEPYRDVRFRLKGANL